MQHWKSSKIIALTTSCWLQSYRNIKVTISILNIAQTIQAAIHEWKAA